MRKRFRWLLLVAFLVVNGGIVHWAWRELSDAADEVRDRSEASQSGPAVSNSSRKSQIAINPSSSKEELRKASAEFRANTEKMAFDLIAKWNRDQVVNLDLDHLASAVESLPEAGCILLPEGAIMISSAELQAPVKRDLDAAVTGLLKAYRDGKPDAVIKYMSERGKVVDSDLRKRVERAERKRAERAERKQPKSGEIIKDNIVDLETLTDEDVYRTMWAKSNAHWSGLVADSCCRQFWDGRNAAFDRVSSFNRSFVTGALTKPRMEQAEYLVHLLHGVLSGRHNFVSTKGSLDDAHKSGAQVLLCDVQLVMELDESFSRVKVPYLIRFWFNEALGKWQPVAKICFTPSPEGGPLPSAPF